MLHSRQIYLIRHGITDWNRDSRMQGQTDIPLNEEGLEQARRIAERLANLSSPPQRIVSSDLSRARQTAETVAQRLNLCIETTPLLRETNLGDWEGLTHNEIIERGDAELFARYQENSFINRPPNAETLESAWERMVSALAQIKARYPSESIAIVGHGGSLRVLIYDALGAPVSSVNRIWLANASLSIIEERFREGKEIRRGIALLNDTGHLQ
ncbi:MAG: histidine phosphatase family protein [Armatimonadetes bacterium]|nr:histidine phosphatase family protein [Armatimonadota bacterium]